MKVVQKQKGHRPHTVHHRGGGGPAHRVGDAAVHNALRVGDGVGRGDPLRGCRVCAGPAAGPVSHNNGLPN